MKIVELDVQILIAPDDGLAYWVSNFIVPRANELLVRIRTQDGVEGFGPRYELHFGRADDSGVQVRDR